MSNHSALNTFGKSGNPAIRSSAFNIRVMINTSKTPSGCNAINQVKREVRRKLTVNTVRS